MKKGKPSKPDARQEDNIRMCVCEGCPSYVDCGGQGGAKEKAFCLAFVGMSKCITREKGCLCGACPVKQSLNLRDFYFCTKGSEGEQNETSKG